MLGNTLWNYETCWESIGNIGMTKENKRSPLSSKEKGSGPLAYRLVSLAAKNFYALRSSPFFNCYFLPVWWCYFAFLAQANGRGRIVGTYCNQFGQHISVLGYSVFNTKYSIVPSGCAYTLTCKMVYHVWLSAHH
jgi:hypothetical protein